MALAKGPTAVEKGTEDAQAHDKVTPTATRTLIIHFDHTCNIRIFQFSKSESFNNL